MKSHTHFKEIINYFVVLKTLNEHRTTFFLLITSFFHRERLFRSLANSRWNFEYFVPCRYYSLIHHHSHSCGHDYYYCDDDHRELNCSCDGLEVQCTFYYYYYRSLPNYYYCYFDYLVIALMCHSRALLSIECQSMTTEDVRVNRDFSLGWSMSRV